MIPGAFITLAETSLNERHVCSSHRLKPVRIVLIDDLAANKYNRSIIFHHMNPSRQAKRNKSVFNCKKYNSLV